MDKIRVGKGGHSKQRAEVRKSKSMSHNVTWRGSTSHRILLKQCAHARSSRDEVGDEGGRMSWEPIAEGGAVLG